MVESCNLLLYDDSFHKGSMRAYWEDTDLRASNAPHLDRDHSAKLSGSCKNTSYLVFEHPWGHKGENGGLAYLVGESDKPGNLGKTGQNDYEKGRYWKRGGRGDNIVRINIPSEDVNEGRMREDIKVFGKRNSGGAGDTHLHLYRDNNGNPNASDQWLTGIYNNQGSIKKGTPCPGGDAYWKNAINPEISCVYDVKTGDKLGRIRTLHGEIKNSSIPNDPRKAMFENIATKYCDRADRLDDRIKSAGDGVSTCRAFSDAKKMAKEHCEKGDRIKTDTMLCTNEDDSLGPTLYDELASKYCDANPNDPFCGCYNVVTNKCKGEDIDKEIKKLEDGRKGIEGVRYVWYGFDNKSEYLNIAQIEVYSDGVNIVKDIDGSKVTIGSRGYETGSDREKYGPEKLFDGNYDTFYHSALEAGWKTTLNKRYQNKDRSKGIKYIDLWTGRPTSASYKAELGEDEPTSYDECKNYCAKNSNCKSIEIGKGGKFCTLMATKIGSGPESATTTVENNNYFDIVEKIGDTQHNFVKIDLGKEYTIDQVKVFNRTGPTLLETGRWAGSYVKLLRSNGSLIKASERVVGDYKQGGERVITFFDNGVGAAKAKANIPGCKITVPIRRTLTDLPRKYSAALDGSDKCWGNVCGPLNEIGGDNFVPKNAIVAGGICSKSMTICNVDLRAGNLQDSEINIEQKCGEYEGEPSPMSEPSSNEPSEPSDGSTDGTPAPMGSSSVPVTPSSTPTSSSTPSVVAGTASTEELKIYEKPSVQIGTVASSLVSISSCAMLIMLAM